MVGPPVCVLQFSRVLVALTLHNAWRQVVDGPCQARVSPRLLQSQHQPAGPLTELRAGHIAVVLILIGVGHLVAETGIPHKPFPVARHVQRVTEESVVGLVLSAHISTQSTLGLYGLAVQDDHTGHGVRAIHQRGGAFQYLYRVDGTAVHFHAVLVAPLLAFLPHALAHDDDAVVAQPADDGLRDTAASGQLAHAGLMGYGVDDVG